VFQPELEAIFPVANQFPFEPLLSEFVESHFCEFRVVLKSASQTATETTSTF
jgi:hypothetical protein